MKPFRKVLHVSGDSFGGAAAPPVSLEWESTRPVCNPAAVGVAAHTTIKIRNVGNTTTTVKHTRVTHSDAPSTLVKCTPSSCVLEPGATQIMSVAVAPRQQHGVWDYTLSFVANGSVPTADVVVVHTVYEPSITFGSGGNVTFVPTASGARSETTLNMRSDSQVSVSFEWQVPPSVEGIVDVHPRSGSIPPNQSLQLRWVYLPRAPGTVCTRIPVVLKTDGIGGEHTTSVMVTGRSQRGSLVAVPEVIDFGNVVRGETASSSVVLYNPSEVDVTYNLNTDAVPCVVVDPHCAAGVLKPLERRTVRLFVNSHQRGEGGGAITDTSATPVERSLVTVKYTTVFPELVVSNACSNTLSKSEVWRRFCVARLNDHVGVQRSARSEEDEELVFNFGAGLVGSHACDVHLELYNPGSCDAEWALQFPNDLGHVPSQRWAESDDPDPATLHERTVLKAKVFTAAPSVGTLKPGERATVKLRYKHTRVSLDTLAVVFKLAGRIGVPLRLVGRTIPRGQGFIDFEREEERLVPQPIGMQLPPVQYVMGVNRGDKATTVTLDKTDLTRLSQSNFGFPVLQCGGSSTRVEPGRSLVIPIRFQPMEAKVYTAQLGVIADDGQEQHLSVVAQGFDPRTVETAIDAGCSESVPSQPFDESDLVGSSGGVALTCDALDFGEVATNSVSHRVLCVRNASKSGQASVFDFSAGEFSSVLLFTPSKGRVDPGEVALVRVTFRPGGVPQIYAFDAVCSVTDEEYVLAHQRSVDAYEKSVTASKATFNITDSGRSGRGRAGGYTEAAASSGGGGVTDSELRTGRYQALPPIKTKEVVVLPMPEPMKPPHALHCAVAATVVSAGMSHDSEHIDRHVHEPTHAGLHSGSTSEDVIVCELLENMLCDVLDDADFHSALLETHDATKPNIYYRQLLSTSTSRQLPVEETHRDTALLSCLEDVLENTLANIAAEALEGSFDITARTRRIVSSAGQQH